MSIANEHQKTHQILQANRKRFPYFHIYIISATVIFHFIVLGSGYEVSPVSNKIESFVVYPKQGGPAIAAGEEHSGNMTPFGANS
jgi:hypothetical protein